MSLCKKAPLETDLIHFKCSIIYTSNDSLLRLLSVLGTIAAKIWLCIVHSDERIPSYFSNELSK